MMNLETRWSEAAKAGETWKEYPRPQLVRDSFFSLNGRWQYVIVKEQKQRKHQTVLPLQKLREAAVHGEKSAAESRGRVSQPNKVCGGTILVPFCPESALSGVQHVLQPDEILYYKKTFVLPERFRRADGKDRVLLHFGAVDQVCHVYINGKCAGRHTGGYTAFTFDITPYLRPGLNELRLRVRDWTEEAPFGRGKQLLHPHGKYSSLFYTPCSGIWKSVWLECVPKAYIRSLCLTPYFDEGEIGIRLNLENPDESSAADDTASASKKRSGKLLMKRPSANVQKTETEAETTSGRGRIENVGEDTKVEETASVRISLRGETVLETELQLDRGEQRFDLGQFEAWTPEHPVLYDICIKAGEDEVRSYFGMRKISTRPDQKGILRFYLNNEPIFINGLLDQGYWPDGLLTAPSADALRYDIEKLKGLGYNLIRKHIKVEPERFYYDCDRLGMLVWQDMPNGGGRYNMFFVTELPNTFDFFCRAVKDNAYRLFARRNKWGRSQYYEELEAMIRELYNHPSVIAWVPFNEGWGQFDANEATRRIRALDPTRLINEACGWFDQGGGDMYTIHNYRRPLSVKPQPPRVVALTEYGGYSLPVPGHMACEKEFGYKAFSTKEALTDAYEALVERDVLRNLSCGLSAAIYTQVSDIEEEINGLMTYDRAEDKLLPERVQEINKRLMEAFSEVVS